MDTKNQSRFSTLRVFKLGSASKPPPPPPKDYPVGLYAITPYMTAGASTSQLTVNTTAPSSSPDLTLIPPSMRSPKSDDTRLPHSQSPLTPQSPYTASPSRSPQSTSTFKKGFLSAFGKRPNRSQTATPIPPSPSLSALQDQPSLSDAEGISAPWNFKHHVHVNGDLHGLPTGWTATLAEAGFSEQEIAELRSRQRVAPLPSRDSSQFTAARPPHLGDPPSVTLGYSTPPRDPPHSIPPTFGSSDMTPVVNPNPRSDSLHGPALATHSASTSTLSTHSNTIRRSPSPASSSNSYLPATHMVAASSHYAPSYAQSQAQSVSSNSPSISHLNAGSASHSSTDSAPLSPSHTSSRSPPPAPLALRTFRVVNEDPTPTPSSPPPAYASPTLTRTMASPRGGKVQRRGSTEKVGLHEPEAGSSEMATMVNDERPASQHEETVPVIGASPEVSVVDTTEQFVEESPAAEVRETVEEQEEAKEQEMKEQEPREGHEDDLSEIPSPTSVTSPISRMAAMPPRLSLHTDQDDGWGDMFSFLPSTSSGSGESSSSSPGVGISTPLKTLQGVKSKRMSTETTRPPSAGDVRSKRRSMRFSTTLAIVPPTNYIHTTISPPPSGPSHSPQPVSSQLISPAPQTLSSQTSLISPPDSSTHHPPDSEATLPSMQSRDPEPTTPQSLDSELSSYVTIYPPPADVGVLTPDPAYPITASPLWQEVRTLVRDGVKDCTTEGGKHGAEDNTRQETGAQKVILPSSEAPILPSPDLLRPPDSPGFLQPLSSRFSDASSFRGHSHFSEATLFQEHSRFSDATSFQGHSRLSELSLAEVSQGADLKSRFSAWSASSRVHGHPSTSFLPLEAMPESPSANSQKLPVFLPSRDLPLSLRRKSTDLPPPHPPPQDDLPPPPAEAESDQPLSPNSVRISHLSSVSNISTAQIHGAKIATITQANIIPVKRPLQLQRNGPMSISTSPPPSTSSKTTVFFTPTSSPQNQHHPSVPLPPLSKILPSLVASPRFQERRRQETQSSQSSTGQGSQESMVEPDYTPPASASSSSHSPCTSNSTESGGVFESTFGHEDDPRSLSASATSYEEPPKSPMLAYLDNEIPSSPKPIIDVVQHPQSDDDDDNTMPLGSLSQEVTEYSEGDGLQEYRSYDQKLPEHGELVDVPDVYDHEIALATPSITVNGLQVDEASPSSGPEAEHTNDLPLALIPLQDYIYLDFDPLEMFSDLQEVAQGQYGSVYAANVSSGVLGIPDSLVAVKKVPIPATGTPKIRQLQHELDLMSQVRHKHILGADGLFFDFAADTLWIRMELMERSLADILVLSEEGLELDEQVIARFASDALLALAYLSDLGIAHRDLRSDNLLISNDGVLKLADFSNGIRVTEQDPLSFEIVGVHHWQAPEMRSGHYDVSKVDIWSLGATVWEAAEGSPPFADVEDTSALGDRWPPLARAEAYSDVFHEFLRLCSEPPVTRPFASQLLHNPFIQQACPRDDIFKVLNLCRTIEEGVQQRPNGDS